MKNDDYLGLYLPLALHNKLRTRCKKGGPNKSETLRTLIRLFLKGKVKLP